MTPTAQIVSVFGSAYPRPGDAYYGEARHLGTALVEKGFVVRTGGYGGIMEAVSRGAKDGGGRTIGITMRNFKSRANQWIDEEIRKENWQERLFDLVDRACAYVFCPGGTGTLVELAVVWEMINKRLMEQKPMVLLGNFWQPVIQCIRDTEFERGMKADQPPSPFYVANSPSDAAAYVAKRFDIHTASR